jgi:hypothetical protein
LALAVAIPAAGYRHRVRDVSAEAYSERATDLVVSSSYRIGFFDSQHGGYLVRAPNLAGTVPRHPEKDAGFVAAMRRDLSVMPIKAFSEGVFYLFLFGILSFAVPWLFRRLATPQSRWWRRLVVGGGLGLLFGAIAMLPQLTLGYGWSAFTTYIGPYPSTYSGPYPGISFVAAETVSYRPFLEVLLKLPVSAYCSSYLPSLANPVRPLWVEVLLELLPKHPLPTRLFGLLGYWGCIATYFLSLGAIASLFVHQRRPA